VAVHGTARDVRVGLLVNTFDLLFGEKAGGHVHFLEVAKRWGDLDVWIFAPEFARATIERELPRATFVALPAGRWLQNFQLRNLWRTIASVTRIRELRSCDVLLATSHFMPDVVPAALARRSPFVVCIQHVLKPAHERPGPRLPNIISSVFQEVAFRIIRTSASAILVNSLDVATRIGVDRQSVAVHVMTHGVDHVHRSEVPDTRRSADALYLGRLVPTKGLEDLLAAWPSIARASAGARLTIAGAGDAPYERRLKDIASRIPSSRPIEFLGRVDEEVKARCFERSSIFLFPSKEEGWGIAIAEAMSFGLPCVVYDLPAYRNVFVAGCLVAPLGDVDRFAALALSILTDDDLRARLAAEASELARTFSWDVAAEIERKALAGVLG